MVFARPRVAPEKTDFPPVLAAHLCGCQGTAMMKIEVRDYEAECDGFEVNRSGGDGGGWWFRREGDEKFTYLSSEEMSTLIRLVGRVEALASKVSTWASTSAGDA